VALSLRRANAPLVREGVPAQAITVIGSGEIVIWIVDAKSSGSTTRCPNAHYAMSRPHFACKLRCRQSSRKIQ
jgi:hypothetical protein